ncbi:MAG: hypothetical protein IJZ31_02120 [Bacteroidaceae bacterium]|nr:hypothetical protein [Bacteroidaceae bacterium]
MSRRQLFICILLVCSVATFAQPIREVRTDLGLQMQPDEKIQWMRDARIGMFIQKGQTATLKGLNLPKEDVTIVCVELNKNL